MRYEFSDLDPDDLARIYAKPADVRSRLNLVIDSAGDIAGVDGSSQSLTSTHDRMILKLLRSRADAVVVGANSVRHEGWHIPQSGELIVISNGTLDDLPACPSPEQVRLLSYEAAIARCGDLSSWILEGGKSVAIQMLHDDLIDQLCLSFRDNAAMRTFTDDIPLPMWISEATVSSFELSNVIADEGMLFTIWRRGINE